MSTLVRRSTNRWVRRSCSASDRRSSIARVRSCQWAGSRSQSGRLATKVQVRIWAMRLPTACRCRRRCGRRTRPDAANQSSGIDAARTTKPKSVEHQFGMLGRRRSCDSRGSGSTSQRSATSAAARRRAHALRRRGRRCRAPSASSAGGACVRPSLRRRRVEARLRARRCEAKSRSRLRHCSDLHRIEAMRPPAPRPVRPRTAAQRPVTPKVPSRRWRPARPAIWPNSAGVEARGTGSRRTCGRRRRRRDRRRD